MIDLKLPTNSYDSFEEMDNITYLVIPLIVLLRSNYETDKRIDKDGGENKTGLAAISEMEKKGKGNRNLSNLTAGNGNGGQDKDKDKDKQAKNQDQDINDINRKYGGGGYDSGDDEVDPEDSAVKFEEDITALVNAKVFSGMNKIPYALENALFALLEPKYLGLMSVSNEKLQVSQSLGLGRSRSEIEGSAFFSILLASCFMWSAALDS